jgi:hypothetical protein
VQSAGNCRANSKRENLLTGWIPEGQLGKKKTAGQAEEEEAAL